VTTTAAQAAWRPHEAQVLAGLWRSARLTVLYGESPQTTTALLRSGVLPLLRSEPAAEPPREVVIDLDDWSQPPLPVLHALLSEAVPEAAADAGASLAERLRGLQESEDVRCLFLFDRFEDFLEAPPDREDLRAFSHEFVQAVNQPGLPANFLIALREDAKPLLKRLRRRIPGLAQHGLRLSSCEDGSLQLLPVLEQDACLRSGTAAAGEPHPSMKTQDVYASIEALLAKTVDASREAPWQAPSGEPDPAESVLPPVWRNNGAPAPAPAARAALPDAGSPPLPPLPPALPSAAGRRWRTYAIAAAVMLPLLLAAWMLGERSARPPAAEPGTEPVLRIALLTDADAPTQARVSTELARQLAPAARVELSLASPPDGTAAWAATAGPGLALVRADALQAARDGGGAPLRIVAPMFLEEVHVIVRADSPLSSIQQLKGRRINVGPAAGARARTATRLYEALFAARLPASAAGALPLDAALRQLLDRKGLDAMILVDAQPSAWLAAQDPQTLRAIKLLGLGDVSPASRKALRGWLPATLHGDAPTPTLAQMSFLVASAAFDDTDPDALGRVALALCRALPSLRRDGHAKWLEVQPGWHEEAGWPYSPSAVRGFRACAAAPK
jgi:hypothetical protein